MSTERPTIICITPIKNEAWILDRFLSCASLWADHIILADEHSTDNSVEIAAKYPKARVIKNNSDGYNELYRQNLLLSEARKISGKKLFITLDADEFLTANFFESNEWKTILAAEEGTLMSFNWVNINPDFETCFVDPYPMIFGFMDNGAVHIGYKLHSQRVPLEVNSPIIHCKEIKTLHYNYVHQPRLISKLNWYKVLELNTNKSSKPKYINHRYRFQNLKDSTHTSLIKKEWLQFYMDKGIDMTSIRSQISHITNPQTQEINLVEVYWRDKEVLEWIEQNGAQKYAYLDIWDVPWVTIAAYFGKNNWETFKDPRTFKHKLMIKLFSIYYKTKTKKLRFALHYILKIANH